MKKYMELPADYAVLSDDEMTYTTGGSAVGGVVTIVGVAYRSDEPSRQAVRSGKTTISSERSSVSAVTTIMACVTFRRAALTFARDR